tara:strand:+ start:6556 stop:6705 length:150 start_codon:yes stop_codon:yes gene_type:complete
MVGEEMDNFIEVTTKEEANKVDLMEYRFVVFSETRQKYIFVKRKYVKEK